MHKEWKSQSTLEPCFCSPSTPTLDENESTGKLTAQQRNEKVEEAQKLKRKRKKVIELFNSGNGKLLRLSDCKHLKIGNWNKKKPNQTISLTCILCGKGANYHCSACGVVLHKDAAYKHPQTTSCWDLWHTNKTNLISKYSDPKPRKRQKTVSMNEQASLPLRASPRLEARKKISPHSRKQTDAQNGPSQPPVATSPVVTRRQTRSVSAKKFTKK
jgi:hypothetical protein